MRFATYITMTTYTVTLVGLLCLTLVEGLGLGFTLFIWVVTLTSLLLRNRLEKSIPKGVWNLLALLLIVPFLLDYLFLSASLVSSAARFLAILYVLKLYDLKTSRDHLILHAIVFFELLAASASTTNPLFMGVIFLFVVTTIWTMIVFNIEREATKHGIKEPPSSLFSRLFFLSIVALTLLSLFITLLLFFVIPRLEFHLFETESLNTIKVSGFSDTVELGSIGTVKLDSTVVMRIETSASPPLYMRGAVLHTYEDGVWKKTELERHLVKKIGRGVFLSGYGAGSALYRYRVLLEPIDSAILPVPPLWTRIEGNFTGIWTDPTATLYLPAPPLKRIEYTLWAPKKPRRPMAGELLHTYLEVPPATKKAVAPLAQAVTKGLDSALEKATAIEEYLKGNYRYTLSVEGTEAGEPIENFLFHTKAGWCEQFASSMVIMLRTVGIPARLVTGFAGGQWNPYGNYYIIRQRDAHTWVEAFIEDRGWVSFDPTPPQQALAPARTSSLSLYIDALHWHWYRYIVNYTLSDQIRAARSVETTMGRLKGLLKESLSGLKKRGTLIWALPLTVLVAIALVLVVLLARRRSSTPKTLWFYQQMLSILARRGLHKAPHETPMEFARRTNLQEVVELSMLFQKLRYGGKKPTEEDMIKARGLLKSLRRRVKAG